MTTEKQSEWTPGVPDESNRPLWVTTDDGEVFWADAEDLSTVVSEIIAWQPYRSDDPPEPYVPEPTKQKRREWWVRWNTNDEDPCYCCDPTPDALRLVNGWKQVHVREVLPGDEDVDAIRAERDAMAKQYDVLLGRYSHVCGERDAWKKHYSEVKNKSDAIRADRDAMAKVVEAVREYRVEIERFAFMGIINAFRELDAMGEVNVEFEVSNQSDPTKKERQFPFGATYEQPLIYIDSKGRLWKGPLAKDSTLHYATANSTYMEGTGREGELVWVVQASSLPDDCVVTPLVEVLPGRES